MADDLYGSARSDLVLGVGPSGLILANLTPRSPIQQALDLGSGCGLQALLASRHAERVIATDINPRALSMTSLNAERNRIHNVEMRLGDLFDPIEGMRFDLILCNPPYVVSPDETYAYRDGGWQDGGILHRIFRRVADFLVDGGFAVINAQWPIYSGDSWFSEPARWTQDRCMDLWLICHGLARPEDYARAWLENGAAGTPVDAVARRWTTWYTSQNIQALATGTVILRRRKDDNWRRAIRAPRNPGGECGDQIERIFKAQDDFQNGLGSEMILQSRFSLAPETRIVPTSEDKCAVMHAGSDPDIGWNLALDSTSLAVLERISGQSSVDRIIDQITKDGLRKKKSARLRVTETIRQLYGGGFLIRSL